MKNHSFHKISFVLLVAALLPLLASAQGKATISVSDITPIPDLVKRLTPAATLELNSIIESLNGKLGNQIQATRKFDVISRSDTAAVTKEQQFGASGNVDVNTAAQAGKISGVKYLLTADVDDFQDYFEKATFEGTGDTATKRIFRFSITARIVDATTEKVLASVAIETGNDQFKQIEQEHNYSVKNGELSDEMMQAISTDMAKKIAVRVADVLAPIKVLIKNDKEITINRGDGAGVAVGDTFNVFALGQELIDPDTKESLGRQEVKVGQVKITEVDPTFSKAEVLEDTGIDTGAILRKPQ